METEEAGSHPTILSRSRQRISCLRFSLSSQSSMYIVSGLREGRPFNMSGRPSGKHLPSAGATNCSRLTVLSRWRNITTKPNSTKSNQLSVKRTKSQGVGDAYWDPASLIECLLGSEECGSGLHIQRVKSSANLLVPMIRTPVRRAQYQLRILQLRHSRL